MSTPICGHDRQTVATALEIFDAVAGGSIACMDNLTALELAAVFSLDDPAELAEMLAEEGRRVGFADISAAEFAPADELRVRAQGEVIMLLRRLKGHHKYGGPLCTAAQARAILLEWLQCNNQESALEALRKERG